MFIVKAIRKNGSEGYIKAARRVFEICEREEASKFSEDSKEFIMSMLQENRAYEFEVEVV